MNTTARHRFCSFISLGECVRRSLRRKLRLPRALLMLGAGYSLVSSPPVNAVELPVVCVAGACGTSTSSPQQWVTSGSATWNASGNTLTVNQSTEQATLNWQSFNISADGKVIFTQPSTTSIALNRIFQGTPSTILGSISTQLNSDSNKTGGQVYLVNQNGFVFGSSSRVNASGILASTLGISDDVFKNGLLSAINNSQPALSNDAATQASVIVNAGAQMTTSGTGGRILLAGHEVDNAGTLITPEGQVILAAGDKVYLSESHDSSLRGLVVEVANGGTAWNQLTGNLSASGGNITMIGLAVNQDGRISASTSVNENGSVKLIARDSSGASTLTTDAEGNKVWTASRTGAVTLGSQSSIDVSADLTDTTTAVDDQAQLTPTVEVVGKQIVMKNGAAITAHGGSLTMTASADPNDLTVVDADVRLRIDSGASIDLSGSNTTRSIADNIVSVELRGTELADSPDQRNGALRGQTVTVDARAGTNVADVSGAISTIGKTVAQRLGKGGTATFNSTGDIVVSKDATVDVSGGQTTYTGAMVSTSQLITADGKLVDIGSAKEEVTYVGVVNPTATIKHDRWGVVEKVLQQTGSHYEEGYVQGGSAGSVQFTAPAMVLDGTFTGKAVNGAYQRDKSSAVTGGTFIVGSSKSVSPTTIDYRAPSLTLTSDTQYQDVADDQSLPANASLTLSTDYLTRGGFTQTYLYSNDKVTIAENTPLNLLAGSTLHIYAKNLLDINSSVTAQSGTLDFSATTLNLANGVKLDVSGTWINDTEVANKARPTTSLDQDAGRISLASTAGEGAGVLNIGTNTQLVANGGAWLKSNGTVVGGRGGEIDLLGNGRGSTAFALGDNVSLQAHGVNGASGGTFKLAAGRVQISNGDTWASAQIYDPAAGNSFFNVGSALFSDYGFASFSLIASGGTSAAEGDALRVVSGTTIDAVASTLQLNSLAGERASGGDVSAFSTVTLYPEYQRTHAATINLSVSPYSSYQGTTTLGTLDVQQGATISGDAGTTINLSSRGGSIAIDGDLIAKGGSIDIELSKPVVSETTPYDPNLGIDIGATARLDVSGTAVLTPNDAGVLQGKLYDGGSITLTADRGSVLIENGSSLSVSGTSATLDIASGSANQSSLREQVASDAGSISISASEAVGLYGELDAHAGQGTSGKATGGTLSLQLTDEKAGYSTNAASGVQVSPVQLHTVELTSEALPTSTGTLAAGSARISAAQIEAAGVDDLRLTANSAGNAQVMLDAGVNLSLDRRIEISAPSLSINTDLSNAAAVLSAPYVLIGNQNNTIAGTATGGTGILNINATDMIDIIGSSAWQNISAAILTSAGDIRLRGVTHERDLTGDLNLLGDLTLKAERVYVATAAQFTINAGDVGTAKAVDIEQTGSSPGVPLTAASSITINASTIEQNGTLLAPFGTITLNADTLVLGDNSLTSVSGDDTVIPYGFTDANGKTWYYTTGLDTAVTGVPSRTISLNGKDVRIASGATIDVSGGGDLYAYEWVAGTGGSKDMLSSSVSPNLFAIIPSLGTQSAPYDAEESRGSSLQAGDTIYLSAASGVPAGYYTLLPARYALLPGAYLVTAVAGYTNLQAGTTASLADGTTVVAGYRSFSNTGLGGTTYSGFAVYPGSWGKELAEYKDTYASTHFSTSTTKTADAGQLSISTTNTLSALGTVKSQAASGGDAATIDVSAENLEVVGTLGTASTSTVQLEDDVLNKWKAGHLLLGGQHSDHGKTITVTADTVTVAGDAHLTADEIALVARDSVAINTGGSVRSTSSVTDKPIKQPETSTIKLTGSGAANAAFVAVSDIDNIALTRDGSAGGSANGVVSIADSAQLGTRGAMVIDAPGGAMLAGTLGGNGASWSVGSGHVVFGDSSTAGQLTVTSDLLAAMQSASAVSIASAGSVDFTHYSSDVGHTGLQLGSDSAPLDSISLTADTLNNLSGDSVALNARSITLQGGNNSDASSIAATVTSGSGALNVNAEKIVIGGAGMGVDGFAEANFNASQISVSGSGALVTGGDLNVSARRITAVASSDGTLHANGNVKLSSSGGAADTSALELGGKLAIEGTNITDDAQIVLPSGLVKLAATNQLSLGADASIDVGGTAVYAAGQRADSNGGTITLSAGNTLNAAAGSKLSIGGSGDSDAGTLNFDAVGAVILDSTLDAHASEAATGGSFVLQAGSVSNFAALNANLQKAGFTRKQSVNVKHGDLTLAAGTQTTAHDVQLVTDDGVITVAGIISAPSTKDRGSIRLYGADGVTLTSTGTLHADGDSSSGRGGTIEIGISTNTTLHPNARIDLQTGSVVTANGAELGRMTLRAPAIKQSASDTTLDDIAISELNADVSHLAKVTLEAVLPGYDAANFSDSSALTSAALLDATNYIAAANANVHSRLNSNHNAAMVLSPGVEITSATDINLGALDLSTWRFNGAYDGSSTNQTPVALTVRAAGSINITGTISDGFRATGSGSSRYTYAGNDSSATLRFVAGSTIDSADPLTIARNSAADINLSVPSGESSTIIRTGTGNLSLVASRDVVFGSGTSVYTGGVDATAMNVTTSTGASSSFLTGGGQLLISAGRDVWGYAVIDSVTAWQPRTGCISACGSLTANQRLASWGVDLRQFQWNAGTLGGGDLTVSAGRDVTQLSAAAADSAKQTSDKVIHYYGGGSLDVEAGNNINSGMLYVGRSAGTITAGGSIAKASGWQDNGKDLGLLLAMGDAQVAVRARNGIDIAGVVNPTVLPLTTSGKQTIFTTYDEDSSLEIDATAGNVVIEDGESGAFFGVQGSSIDPANVTLNAFSGSLIDSRISLFPSSRGELKVFVAEDIVNSTISMLDAATSQIYTPSNPVVLNLSPTSSPKWSSRASTDTFFNTARHLGDEVPNEITAGRDITGSTFQSPKALHVSAGRDFTGARIVAQNINTDDVTEISAGRDLTVEKISVGGPGQLEIVTGRNVDLGGAEGVVTTGNQENANLPTAQGADITVLAGMSADWDVNGFIDSIVAKSATGSQSLIEFVEETTHQSNLKLADAVSEFKTLPAYTQRPFVLKQFFNELVASGKEANTDASKGYSRGYAAIDALLPGSRSGSNPYSGDISLLYSQIYTKSGGNINLVTPGGGLNVGVASKPLFVSNKKPAGELGIVAVKAGNVNIFANNDVLVNSSRVFTLGGGDIAIWSTFGNIDAGKGAKTSLSVPSPKIAYDERGNAYVDLSGAVAGSGIRTIQTDSSVSPGNVDLIAPAGYVNAGDAGIGSSGNINIAARQVIGAENINFSGSATGVPAETSGIAASLTGVSAVGSATDSTTASAVDASRDVRKEQAPLAQAALSWLEVFVVGLGEEGCKQDDVECLKRQKNE